MSTRYKVRTIPSFVKVLHNSIMLWREFLRSNAVNHNANLVRCADSARNSRCWRGSYRVLKLKNGGTKAFGEDSGYDNWQPIIWPRVMVQKSSSTKDGELALDSPLAMCVPPPHPPRTKRASSRPTASLVVVHGRFRRHDFEPRTEWERVRPGLTHLDRHPLFSSIIQGCGGGKISSRFTIHESLSSPSALDEGERMDKYLPWR